MCIIDCLSTIVFILPLHLDYTKVIILILWWRNFQLEYWRTFQLVSTDMGFDEEGNGSFNGLTETEQARFKQAIQAAGANFAAAMDMYKDLF